MRKTVVVVFAHPDDEAFGPSGTIAKLAKDHDVHLVCVTDGETDPRYKTSSHDNLKDVRSQELHESAEVLGVKSVTFLHYKDGSLCNNMYHTVADDIQKHLERLKPDTLLTFEQRGVSGHLDHIAVTMIVSYLFDKLHFVRKVLYYCISEQQQVLNENYFIFFPPGYRESQVDMIQDVSGVWDRKIAAILKHQSQKADIDVFLPIVKKLPKQELFLVRNK